MNRYSVREAVRHVGLALRQPEEFAVQWDAGKIVYPFPVWLALFLTAVMGTATYGLTMGLMSNQADTLLEKSVACTVAAGAAWSLSLPTLYILHSLSGSRLSASSTLLAALVTVSWGGLAMVASVPINWFFTVAIPHAGFVLLINLLIFTGVGVAMVDVFRRVMLRLEPERVVAPMWWILLVTVIGGELFYAFGLFQF